MQNRKQTPQERYHAAHAKAFTFRFMKNTEADIISHLERQQNKAGYIKELIRKDMAK